jgi:hypothetical protein
MANSSTVRLTAREEVNGWKGWRVMDSYHQQEGETMDCIALYPKDKTCTLFMGVNPVKHFDGKQPIAQAKSHHTKMIKRLMELETEDDE